MASVLETYGRSLPGSFTTLNLNSPTIHTKYGLTMLMTAAYNITDFDELHVLTLWEISGDKDSRLKGAKIIYYKPIPNQYPIDICLKRIAGQYGRTFESFVRVSLDYN